MSWDSAIISETGGTTSGCIEHPVEGAPNRLTKQSFFYSLGKRFHMARSGRQDCPRPMRSVGPFLGLEGTEKFMEAFFSGRLRQKPVGRGKAYEYIYGWRTPMIGGRPGIFHDAELTMVFSNAVYCDRYTGRTREAFTLAQKMSGAWAALAKTGSPQHEGLPEWPHHGADSKKAMIFDNECKIANYPEGKGLSLIEQSQSHK